MNPPFISELSCYSGNNFTPKILISHFSLSFHEQTWGVSWWPAFHFRKSATSLVCLKRIITSAMKCWWAKWRRPCLPYGAALQSVNPSGVTSTCLPSEHHSFIALAFYLLPLKLFLVLSLQRQMEGLIYIGLIWGVAVVGEHTAWIVFPPGN